MKTGILGICSAVLMTVSPASAQTIDLEQSIESALQYAKVQDFDAALSALSSVSADDKTRYTHRFTKARILTWSGRHSEAEGVYSGLLTEYPSNPDVKVSYGYLQFFKGNLQTAESYFNNVLTEHPTYLDAYEGLQRVYDLRRSSKEVPYANLSDAVSCPTGYGEANDGSCHPLSTSLRR